MKFKLETEDLEDDFFEDTHLLGLVAPIKDYQFSWMLNHAINIDFRLNNDLEIQFFKKQRHYYYSIFEYAQPHTSLMHYLYKNQCDGEYLLPELKQFDFLWLLKGDTISSEFLTGLQQSIRGINGVQLVMELAHEKIKHKEHLIF